MINKTNSNKIYKQNKLTKTISLYKSEVNNGIQTMLNMQHKIL